MDEEWDGPWKEALDNLALVFALFWPDVLGEIDIARGWIPFQQELQKLAPDGNSGLLRVDKLFELTARNTADPRFVHFEVQMAKDLELPWRMFKYGRRAGEYFNQPVGRFAILGDDEPGWKPTSYTEGVLGCEDTFTYRVVKLSEWHQRLKDLEAGDNLFGLFLCAHLETMQTRRDVSQRQEAKYRILANLMRREVGAEEFRCWYRLIDWILKLTEDANRAVWHRLEELKEPKPMSHVTFAETYGREKGIKEGMKEGIQEGIKEGIKNSLNEALEAKFPQKGTALAAEFKDEQDVERLTFLLRQAVLALSPEEFRARVSSPS